jgi:hypothetical protein
MTFKLYGTETKENKRTAVAVLILGTKKTLAAEKRCER